MNVWHENLTEINKNNLSPEHISDLNSDEKVFSFIRASLFDNKLMIIIATCLFAIGLLGSAIKVNSLFISYLLSGVIFILILSRFLINRQRKNNYIMITNERMVGSCNLFTANQNPNQTQIQKIIIPLRKVDSITFNTRNELYINSSSSQYFIAAHPEEYKNFQFVFNEYVKNKEKSESQSTQNSTSINIDSKQSSGVNDLEKLADLMKKGILTEEEFNKKKKEILGL